MPDLVDLAVICTPARTVPDARRREVLYETPRDIPVEFPLDRSRLRAVFNTILSEGHDIPTESTSKALLEAYEIPVASCSRESLCFRFRYLFKETTHEMATRFCFIDYHREIAIVAELNADAQRKLIGLGALLTDYCLEICNRWGIGSVVAETAPANHRMLSIFEHRGFELDRTVSSDVVLLRKLLM